MRSVTLFAQGPAHVAQEGALVLRLEDIEFAHDLQQRVLHEILRVAGPRA